MSAKAHPRVVGAFVLGAVVLVLAAILALSSGTWLARKDYFTVYFPGSVRGLNPGAPVTFRGVKVGKVDDVKAFLTGRPEPLIQIEVLIEIWGNVVETPEGVPRPFGRSSSSAEFAQGLINRGVRARMTSLSLLTGQKYIELDFLPKEPARFAGLKPRYPELPTTPSSMEKASQRIEELLGKLSDLPVDRMLENLEKALQSLRTLLESPDLSGAVSGARRAADDLGPTLRDVRLAVAEVRRLTETVGGEVKDTGGETRLALREARARLEGLEKAVGALEGVVKGTDDTRLTAARTLDELARTLKALRNLVDYIQTHPEAVVLGKERAKEKQ
jgi:phospholipid/cholesterol/gamma-HCH transport system substrate-binding protein